MKPSVDTAEEEWDISISDQRLLSESLEGMFFCVFFFTEYIILEYSQSTLHGTNVCKLSKIGLDKTSKVLKTQYF